MSLAPGTRLGAYEILSALGAGGMGEVYRAHDTKLGRDVALKILPASFVGDAERVARFRREAQVLAALNHPHIAAIYGLDDTAGSQFLVLELVDGPTLADRLARGPQPVDEALAIAKQIADALEAAHERGIVHRDLKPSNVAFTSDGRVKVLDFGLAKALDAAPGSTPNVTQSPTITTPAMMTGVGTILGTAAYMSPEQAKGRPADKRSDVWAFGCVVYEMLTGKRAFDGDDVSDVLATVLKGEPDWTALPRDVPPRIRALLQRSLAKDRQTRIADLSVVRFVIDEGSGATAQIVPAGSRASATPWKWAAALMLVTTIGGLAAAYIARSAPAPVVRFFVAPPDKTSFAVGARIGTVAVISPDGRTLAFTARDTAGRTLLWIRSIAALAAQPLAGTDGAAFPFWSPDSRFIAYMTSSKLLKIAVGGGPPQTICALTSSLGRGGTWSRDGVIVFNGGSGTLGCSVSRRQADRRSRSCRKAERSLRSCPTADIFCITKPSSRRAPAFTSGRSTAASRGGLWRPTPPAFTIRGAATCSS